MLQAKETTIYKASIFLQPATSISFCFSFSLSNWQNSDLLKYCTFLCFRGGGWGVGCWTMKSVLSTIKFQVLIACKPIAVFLSRMQVIFCSLWSAYTLFLWHPSFWLSSMIIIYLQEAHSGILIYYGAIIFILEP